MASGSQLVVKQKPAAGTMHKSKAAHGSRWGSGETKSRTGRDEEELSPFKGRPSLAFFLQRGPAHQSLQIMNPLRDESIAYQNPQDPVTSPELVPQSPSAPLYRSLWRIVCVPTDKGPDHVGWGLGVATG